MQINLTPEQEEHLSRIAEHEGTTASQLLLAFVERRIREDEPFVQAVDQGLAALDRGDSLPHEEVVAHMQQLFQAK
jgi:predicted transcriptional regulator